MSVKAPLTSSDTAVDIHAERLLVLDFGSQYTQLIARRLRELGVYCEIFPCDVDEARIRAFEPVGIVLSGGPESTIDDDSLAIPDAVFDLQVPVLGICYGMQAMALRFGGTVGNCGHSEFGHAEVRGLVDSPLFLSVIGVNESSDVWMSHGDRVEQVPDGFTHVAESDNAPIAAIADSDRHYYGVQFHPEVTHTAGGAEILKNFTHSICGCSGQWTAANIIDDAVERIRTQVGDDRVLLALSGGVDSSVVALMLHRAIGDQLQCVFVDNGLLRLDEGDQVMQMFNDNLGVNVVRVNAVQRFLQKLEGVTDPEQKRKVIGNEFIAVFEEESQKLADVKWLAQGTIYPDVIESAGSSSGKAHVIKSHHNVGGLPDVMKLSLIEPLRELFKDEVRRVGIDLGLPAAMVNRHPFPGPGLGVRIIGEVTQEAADILRLADAIFIAELHAQDLYNAVSQAFVVFLPIRSVGVTGDGRRYGFVVALRAVETIDFMTARATCFPEGFLDRVANRILNEIPQIARVVYDISSKPPGTIEWE